MLRIVKCDIKRLLKNPLYYIGFIVIAINIALCCKNYLKIHFYNDDYIPVESSERVELDIYNGYIPPQNEQEQLEIGLNEYKKLMLRDEVMTEEEVDSIIETIKSQNMSVNEALEYLNKNENVKIASDIFSEKNCLKTGDSNELNGYISEKMNRENYTSFFARKFVDYLGIHVIFLSSVLLIFLTKDDFSKNAYELLHTKINHSMEYIVAKFISGFMSLMFFVIAIGLVFSFISYGYGVQQGFEVGILDVWKYIVLCTVPSLSFAVSFYIFITCIFKKPIIALPLMLLLIFYANQGVKESGIYIYKHRLFQITPRFPGLFFETSIDNTLIINQILLMSISIVLICISCVVWERRRII